MKRDRPKEPAAIRGPLGITYQPNEKANVIADCLENQVTSHDLCDENYERPVGTHSPSSASIYKRNPAGESKAM
jgi:hypothetical protein